jgi:hypothetical protein
MPARSAKQERFMQAVAHDPKFAKKAGVPQSVGKEFTKYAEGGPVARDKTLFGKYDERMSKTIEDETSGKPAAAPAPAPAPAVRFDKPVPRNLDQRDKLLKSRGFAAGGSIDGCAQRGKTRAKRS